MAAVANVAVLHSRFFNLCRIQEIHLMPLGAYRRMAQHAVVTEHVSRGMPVRWQTHQLIGKLAMAHKTGVRVYLLAKCE